MEIFWDLLGNILRNKHHNKIYKANEDNRQIIHYQPTSIENIMGIYKPGANILSSGGLATNRNRLIIDVIQKAFLNDFTVIVLHNSDHELVDQISYQIQFNKSLIDKTHPVYDPFIGKSAVEVFNIIQFTEPNGPLNNKGLYYLIGIFELLEYHKRIPNTSLFIATPHYELMTKTQNTVHDTNYRNKILQNLQMGKEGQADIIQYFNQLNQQGICLFNGNPNYRPTNILNNSRNKEITVFDVMSTNNKIMINLVIDEINRLINRDKKVFLLNLLPYSTTNKMEELLSNTSENLRIMICAEDVFANVFKSKTDPFQSFAGRSNFFFFSKHNSATSSEEYSKLLGEYEKVDITHTQGTQHSWSMGSSTMKGATYSRIYERRVKVSDLTDMSPNEFFVKCPNENVIHHIPIQ